MQKFHFMRLGHLGLAATRPGRTPVTSPLEFPLPKWSPVISRYGI
jgi:hypothetical protein